MTFPNSFLFNFTSPLLFIINLLYVSNYIYEINIRQVNK
ncbi:hypothetical protein QY96_00418 [Bacillus thermotolerans]|nr:hypothetical protein QY96_00418 [Bacillus thermotolerans]